MSRKYDRPAPYLQFELSQIQEMLLPHFKNAKIHRLTLLQGGFANTNYKIDFADGRKSVVMRFAQRGLEHLRKEVAVLNLVKNRVLIPKPIVNDFNAKFPFAVIEFIEGRPLSEILLEVGSEEASLLGRAVAEALIAIHSIELSHSGFFDAEFKFDPIFENFGQAYIDYMYSCLDNPLLINRVPKETGIAFRQLLNDNEGNLRSLKNTSKLVHCDYNPKNIMVQKSESGWQVTGILDWEFAAAGSLLVDIGNFLRFEDELPLDLVQGFTEGYQASESLQKDWRKMACLLDLASMCSFLITEEERPNAFRTAISIIQKTISRYVEIQK